MKPAHKKALYIALPLILGTAFLIWYLTKNKKKGNYIPEEKPEKAKKDIAKEPSPAVINVSNSYPLKNGVFNSALVSQLQKILNSKGAALTVDGDFGPKTEAALLKYYGKKQIDNAADFNIFKTQVPSTQLINTKTAKAQLIINTYRKSALTEIYCTVNTQLTVVEPAGNSYVLTQKNINFNKLQAFDHDRFVPVSVAPTGDLVVKYISAWLGGETFMGYADPEAFAVKYI